LNEGIWAFRQGLRTGVAGVEDGIFAHVESALLQKLTWALVIVHELSVELLEEQLTEHD